MIEATFIKAVPLKDGTISYMLSGPRTKEALRLAVDLQDEKCEISLATKGPSVSFREPVAEVMDRIHDVISDFYEKLKVVGADFNPVETELKELREEPLYQIPEKGESEE